MLKTFKKGGVHPEEHKLSAQNKIVVLPPPPSVIIPFAQHIGAPAKPLVAKGDKVKTGQLLAQSNGFVSSNIHSSVSGTVIKVDIFLDITGYRRPAVQINVEGDEWIETIDRSNELKKDIVHSPEEIIKIISEAGLVGLGGATFPSHVKLSVPAGKKIEYLIVNGVECEPFLTADHALMLEKGEEIMVGIKIMMKALHVEKAIIGIENNKNDAVKYLSKLTKEENGIEVIPLKVKYPQGGEKQLINALLKREVPSGGLPFDVGVIVFNVGSIFAAYEAVQKNKPLFERVVTVTGLTLKKPSNYLTRIGSSVSYLIENSGGLPEDTGKIICGGPMMGKALNSLDVPVVKSSSGIVVIPQKQAVRKEVRNCIRCSKCVFACPMGLEPFLLMSMGEKGFYERLENEKILDCMECGSCSYICPSGRPLLDYIRLGKTKSLQLIRKEKN